MDPALITAILSLLTVLIPIIGALVGWKINNSRLSEEEKRNYNAINDAVVGAVKAVSQTHISGKRTLEGRLPQMVAEEARSEALVLTKTLMGMQRVQAAAKQYGAEKLDKVLLTQIEARVHDEKATMTTNIKTTTTAPNGSQSTVDVQATTSTMDVPLPLSPPPTFEEVKEAAGDGVEKKGIEGNPDGTIYEIKSEV